MAESTCAPENPTVTHFDENGLLHRSTQNTQTLRSHAKCEKMLERSCCKGKYVKVLLDGLKKLGCDMGFEEKNIVCEPCNPKLYAAFDIDKKVVVVCENNLLNQKFMDDVLTHELIHAYDVCRVKFDKDNLDHLACTSIRVANLSGDCFFWKENFLRFRFGWKAQKQECVRERAVKHMMCIKDIPEDIARETVERVFYACYNDHEPFPKIPPL
ncbi:mitochondrial inner membrane protease ATP23 homolog [Hydractinia symbiolongicarpus]|uniref:mitochondrial inner membrane protease ATP23 homolog n=1 Tax=Hydractinia symbiolongicarpus TaxID=13093 RepID=UPI00254D5668|nr:mitochondrial inner membrane protease ATP23 homolog [Hydractinia symbiolongicarpus]